MQSGIIHCEAPGVVHSADGTALRLLSKGLGDLVGQPWTVVADAFHDEPREALLRSLHAALHAPNAGVDRSGSGFLRDGQIGVTWTIFRLDRPIGECAILLQLSPGKRTPPPNSNDRELAAYKESFTHAVEGFFRTSLEGRYIEVNPALARIYGYDSPQALMAVMSDVSTELYVDRGRREEFVALVRAQGNVSGFQSQVYRADGSVMWIAEYAHTVYDDGRPVYYEGSIIDLTSIKRTEAALRQSEERFRLLVETANVVPWEADMHSWRLTYVGPQAVKFLGFSVEEWLSDGFWQRQVHPEDLDWVSTVRAEGIANHRSFECEYRMMGKGGRVVWVRDVVTIIGTSAGTEALGGILSDISYRRFTEAALREGGNFVESLIESAPMILYLYDLSSEQCLYVSGRAEKILGYSQRALWDMKPLFVSALAHEAEQASHRQHLQALAEADFGQIIEREFRLRGVEGDWVWLRGYDTVYSLGSNGRPEQVLGIAFDFTAQRLAMEELASDETLFRSLAETTRVIPFEMSLDTGRFTYVGPQAEALLGFPISDWFRKDGWLALVHPDDRDLAVQFMYPPSSHPGPETDFQAEFRMRRTNGQDLWVRELVRYGRGADQRLRARGFLFDITEAKNHEEELKTTRDRLRELALWNQNVREDERANVAREIHDELGQALTLFRIDLGWMENRLGRFAATRALEALTGKVNDMKKLVDGTLRTVRRIISNLRPAVLDELGLKAAIEWQAEEFSRRVGIRCQVEAATIPDPGNDTAIAIFRIFQEILTNVLRHAHASRVDVRFSCDGESLTLAVTDNGRGFATNELGHSKSFGLLGMRERARALGGSLEIISKKGTGTTVIVALPLRDELIADPNLLPP